MIRTSSRKRDHGSIRSNGSFTPGSMTLSGIQKGLRRLEREGPRDDLVKELAAGFERYAKRVSPDEFSPGYLRMYNTFRSIASPNQLRDYKLPNPAELMDYFIQSAMQELDLVETERSRHGFLGLRTPVINLREMDAGKAIDLVVLAFEKGNPALLREVGRRNEIPTERVGLYHVLGYYCLLPHQAPSEGEKRRA